MAEIEVTCFYLNRSERIQSLYEVHEIVEAYVILSSKFCTN